MPEEAASTDTTQTNTTPTGGGTAGEGQGFEPITSQDQLNHVLGERLARERAKYADYADLKAKAAKFDEAEEASKTELQKLQEQAARADQRATSAEQAMMRLQACTTAGLPASMAGDAYKAQPLRSWQQTRQSQFTHCWNQLWPPTFTKMSTAGDSQFTMTTSTSDHHYSQDYFFRV